MIGVAGTPCERGRRTPIGTIDPEGLRDILRRFAAGVTVITSLNQQERPAGMTATAFTSVSLEPPQVLVCVNAGARTRQAIESHAGFVVNILSAEQEHVARRFASSASDKFEGIAWHPGMTGAPVLDGALATVECRVAQAIEAGSHVIYVGSVLDGRLGSGRPLLYFEGAYRLLS